MNGYENVEKIKINFENINKNIRKFENEKELLEFIKDKIDFLYRHNKNLTQCQYIIIQDLKEIFENIDCEGE